MIKEIQHYAGDYLEIDFAPYKLTPKRGRSRKAKPSTEAQKYLNQKKRERELYMLIHENFTREDYAIHPTYAERYKPSTPEEALKDRRNFILRLKRLYKKYGVEFKYIAVLEQAAESKRLHHHMIISGKVPPFEIKNAWGLGYCNPRTLEFNERGVIGLACYIVKSAFDGEGEDNRCTYKAYSCSRNLRRPKKPKEKQIASATFNRLYDDRENRQVFEERYKDYFYVEAGNTETPFGEKFLTVRMCRRDAKLDFIEDSDYSGYSGKRWIKRFEAAPAPNKPDKEMAKFLKEAKRLSKENARILKEGEAHEGKN